MTCAKSERKKYVERPGPPYPAQNCKKGARRLGNDGARYVNKEDKIGRLAWKIDTCLPFYDEWIPLAAERYCLRVRDLERMKPGETIRLVTLDRNLCDNIPVSSHGRCHSPVDFFHSLGKIEYYTHFHDLKGYMEGKDHAYDARELFEFSGLLEDKELWYPFKDGRMQQDNNRLYTTYSKNMKLGWRGPSIKYDELLHMPRLLLEPLWSKKGDYSRSRSRRRTRRVASQR